ncbi:SelT/SelW/SelH family protein [Aspergillus clavatus NRRL 1]|uniref:Selenoprotein W family protein n=1 Tax=Aspergillus clavatus (strain ATCC 1007 / CBS 513.65 / DSM 816 / NCTC 3887 / NRRL 1 / QM 1276 / 107) TaxID=344612 RepID=A1CRE3_ASPCL|nr:selenoprotein W family protein [Aspergillus clavatus NRRL 1]EAW08214.1 selenoprotein W family protein [Aspergillus clavatus NRRL 1]
MTEPITPLESNAPPPLQSTTSSSSITHPRITIQYCTQCKWMLRAAYFAQELLSTFGTGIGEVALVPATGGLFRVTIWGGRGLGDGVVLWDRKTEGGFPEVKVLKARVRNVIDPSRDLGHTDRALRRDEEKKTVEHQEDQAGDQTPEKATKEKEKCEDCQ